MRLVRGRRVLVLGLLLLAVGSLRVLAFASPPDPLWVPGVYDAADYDDVVGTVLTLDGLRDDAVPGIERPALIAAPALAAAPAVPRSTRRAPSRSRAPPSR
jgi:hypothetical protein